MRSQPINLLERLASMDFAHRLTNLRKARGLTPQTLVETVGIHVTQIRRYEAGTNQPTLDVLRALAIALVVTTDDLVFSADDTLHMHLATLEQLDPDERASIHALIEGALLRHQARRFSAS